MSKYRDLIESCLKEYDPDDEGDKTWTTHSEWTSYYDQKRKERSHKPLELVRVACISKNMYSDEVIRKLYIKDRINGFDKAFDKDKAKLFFRNEAEQYVKQHPEQVYPDQRLRVVYEIEPI